MRVFLEFYSNEIINQSTNVTVDPHFSRASPLDRRDSLFICEKLIFEKKLESPLILFLF